MFTTVFLWCLGIGLLLLISLSIVSELLSIREQLGWRRRGPSSRLYTYTIRPSDEQTG